MSNKPYSVNYWGSHPDLENDDCFEGEDFGSAEDAIHAYWQNPIDYSVAFIELDGPGINEVRPSPNHNAKQVKRDLLDLDGQSERAMQAGMAFGCQGYNDEMGY